jgi:lipopolysaccharide/colanic/teichoic acid biosynthesis glycosyltransferase
VSIAFELPPEAEPTTDLTVVAVPQQRHDEVADSLRLRDDETARRLSAEITERFGAAPLSLVQRAAKRLVDVVGAGALLLALSPLLLVTALAIKLDSPGPVVFRQQRVGQGGKAFRILKLRSMRTGGDDSAHRAYVEQLMRGEAAAQDGVFKLVADPRITRVGRVIRRYSVDELPQLWNVLRGDMSLVGPRPALPHEVELYDAMARQRLVVKPGVTGLWQVSGRCELSFADMIALDVDYWRRWSLVKDLLILLKTPVAALSGRGAA